MKLVGPVIAILRGGDPRFTVPVAMTLIEAGIRSIEVTTNTPDWVATIATLSQLDGVAVGAGTVMSPEHVRLAHGAGAAFVVSPHLDEKVGQTAKHLGVDWMPGTATPTEMKHGWDLGATAIKVFPVRQLGGPGYLKQVLAALDFIETVPSGGIDPEQLDDYLDAGAIAIGLGGSLIGTALEDGDIASLHRRATDLSHRSRA